jgi:hypothetical protein
MKRRTSIADEIAAQVAEIAPKSAETAALDGDEDSAFPKYNGE